MEGVDEMDGCVDVPMYRHMYAWLEGSVDAYMYSYVSITRFIRPLLQLPALLNLEINMLVGVAEYPGFGIPQIRNLIPCPH